MADEPGGSLFVGEQDWHVWRYGAEPTDPTGLAPVTGMVPFGDGYLMVASDGGIFNFSDRPFSGSLGANPPADPIASVAALG